MAQLAVDPGPRAAPRPGMQGTPEAVVLAGCGLEVANAEGAAADSHSGTQLGSKTVCLGPGTYRLSQPCNYLTSSIITLHYISASMKTSI